MNYCISANETRLGLLKLEKYSKHSATDCEGNLQNANYANCCRKVHLARVTNIRNSIEIIYHKLASRELFLFIFNCKLIYAVNFPLRTELNINRLATTFVSICFLRNYSLNKINVNSLGNV